MHKEAERTAWLDREKKKNREIIKWLLKTFKLNIYIDNLEAAREKLIEAKSNLATEDMIKERKNNNNKIESDIWNDLIFQIKSLNDKDFNRIKSRWSSHTNRKNNESISCSIAPDIHKKLIKIKGKYKLKDTLEVMITLIYNRQTNTPTLDITNPKTTPLLDTIPTTKFASFDMTPEDAYTLISTQNNIGALQNTVFNQRSDIAELLKRIDALERKQTSA